MLWLFLASATRKGMRVCTSFSVLTRHILSGYQRITTRDDVMNVSTLPRPPRLPWSTHVADDHEATLISDVPWRLHRYSSTDIAFVMLCTGTRDHSRFITSSPIGSSSVLKARCWLPGSCVKVLSSISISSVQRLFRSAD